MAQFRIFWLNVITWTVYVFVELDDHFWKYVETMHQTYQAKKYLNRTGLNRHIHYPASIVVILAPPPLWGEQNMIIVKPKTYSSMLFIWHIRAQDFIKRHQRKYVFRSWRYTDGCQGLVGPYFYNDNIRDKRLNDPIFRSIKHTIISATEDPLCMHPPGNELTRSSGWFSWMCWEYLIIGCKCTAGENIQTIGVKY